ncbi:MAG: glycosyltransferase family 4 protein [Chloroflexi bacterium]|nr:glycosyltransferase family 4 protein [Chloroflexota bacterium]
MKIIMIDSLVGNHYTFWLCRGLAEAGNDITLITTKDHSVDDDWPFLILPVSPAKDKDKNKLHKLIGYVYYLIWLFIYILHARADVVHYQFFRRERIECLYFPLLRLISRELVFTAHNILPHENGKIDHYLRYLVYKSANKIIVHTPTIKEILLATFNIADGKVFVVPAVKPNSGVHDATVTWSFAREKLNLSPDAKVLLFFGFIREYKGIDLLLEAFDLARATRNNLQLIIAGNPQPESLRNTYEAQIAAMTYGDDVTLRAEFIPRDEVDYYFRAADALALPYKSIDFSGIMQEAFAYSLPVLVTDVGNFADFIEQGINGYIADDITPEAFAHIIERAFDDEADLVQMGQAAYEIDQAYPDWKQIGKLSLDIYAANGKAISATVKA